MSPTANDREPTVPLLSVVMPVYNEIATIAEVIRRVRAVEIDKELIIVDDYSTDGTRQYLEELAERARNDNSERDRQNPIKILFQDRNQGKGAALRRGFEQAGGEIVVIQDADLELNPREYGKLIEPILANVADIVYGSRFLNGSAPNAASPNYRANQLLTAASNLFTGLCLTDVWTGYKTFRREVLDGMQLRENRFAFEPEFTAKIARRGWRVREVAVSYEYRTQKEGKKISWKDGFRGIACTVYYGALCLLPFAKRGRTVTQMVPVSASHGK